MTDPKPSDLSALLDRYESNMTEWMREPEQYRQMIVKETNKVLSLARWSLEAKEAMKTIGDMETHDPQVVHDAVSMMAALAKDTLLESPFPL